MNVYENFVNDNEEKIVRMGRNLITLQKRTNCIPRMMKCGMQMTAGNKLVTINTTYGMKSLSELSSKEAKAVSHYLHKYGLDHAHVPMVQYYGVKTGEWDRVLKHHQVHNYYTTCVKT